VPTEDPIKFWQHIHGASVHFPIALIICAFLFDFGSTLFKRETWKIVGFWCLIAAAIVALPASISGLAGHIGWFGVKPDPDTYDFTNVGLSLGHRNLALVGTGIAILLAIWRTARRDALKKGEWAAYLILLFGATFSIGVAGFLGAYVRMGSDYANFPKQPAAVESPAPDAETPATEATPAAP
jgi:uncharacterized membrane protein